MKIKLKINSIWCIGVLWLAIACSKDVDLTDHNKINLAENIAFKLDFAAFGSEEELSGNRLKSEITEQPQTIDLGNGLLAQISIQKEKAENIENQPIETRALEDNATYTMLAYDSYTHELKGKMTGYVSGGIWTPTDGKQQIQLVPGQYDFICFNEHVLQEGNNLSVTLSDAQSALIGKAAKINVSGTKQEIVFQMKHAGARMRVKLTGYASFLNNMEATLGSMGKTIPATAVYDASNDAWGVKNSENINKGYTFPASTEPIYTSSTYTSTSNEYHYFLPGTEGTDLNLSFRSGSIYNMDMNGKGVIFNPNPSLTMAANGSYIVNIKLMYNFLYLMSDGTTGLISETTYGSGTKTPVGIVISQSNRLAVALKNASGNTYFQWDAKNWGRQSNSAIFNYSTAVCDDMDGYKWTWLASGSLNGSFIKGDMADHFPAFYQAGHYDPGVSHSGTLSDKKWHLPSLGEWKYFFMVLGFGDASRFTTPDIMIPWYSGLAQVAFEQVGGSLPIDNWYWSSSEETGTYVASLYLNLTHVLWNDYAKHNNLYVRPFIRY